MITKKITIILGVLAAISAGAGIYFYCKNRKKVVAIPNTPIEASQKQIATVDMIGNSVNIDEVSMPLGEEGRFLQGDIDVSSAQGNDSVFTVKFPAIDTEDYIVSGDLVVGGGIPYTKEGYWSVSKQDKDKFELHIKGLKDSVKDMVFKWSILY